MDLSPVAQLACASPLFRVFHRLSKPNISTVVAFTGDYARYTPQRQIWQSVSRVTCSRRLLVYLVSRTHNPPLPEVARNISRDAALALRHHFVLQEVPAFKFASARHNTVVPFTARTWTHFQLDYLVSFEPRRCVPRPDILIVPPASYSNSGRQECILVAPKERTVPLRAVFCAWKATRSHSSSTKELRLLEFSPQIIYIPRRSSLIASPKRPLLSNISEATR
ncbi:hypothetical protein VTO73DRAFT_5516 [Trametes versicolor]